ncbi:MAG: hypothetical protein K940chlam9_00877 [Chlamydiae bacterium]|nr:hypothetical protein [Chlamydiota bacterium]
MKVKIDEKMICVPPYISTTWEQVAFLQSEEDADAATFTLAIHLREGKAVRIPHLDASLIDIAFAAHIKYLETKGEKPPPQEKKSEEPQNFGALLQQLTGISPDQLSKIPIQFRIGGIPGIPDMENMDVALQHNQPHAQTPDLPPEVLGKIVQMVKMMIGDEVHNFPKAEPHCNCPHCQVARVLHGTEKETTQREEEEEVSDEDLTFRTWDVAQTGEDLYTVTNPLDLSEQYSVFLGEPVGCTCGEAHCEHIKAVLYS